MATPKAIRKVGRPTKYKPDVMIPRMLELMAQGATYEQVSVDPLFQVDDDTLVRWEKKYKEFYAARRYGEKLSKNWWIEKGKEGMFAERFNATPWVFSMKNMFGWRDKTDLTSDNQKIDQSTKIANIYAIAESDMAKLLTEKLKDDTK